MKPASRSVWFALFCAMLVLGAPLAQALAASAAEPCMSAMAADGDNASECCDTQQTVAGCALQCDALSGSLLSFERPAVPAVAAAYAVAMISPPDFESLAGPPGLQPPR